MRKFEEAGTRIGNLVEEKNKFYGNSFKDSAYFLKLLYSAGIPPDKYCDILLIVRIFDKLKRIATRKDAFGENPWEDIVGYSLLGTVNDSNQEEEPLFENEVAQCPIHKGDMVEIYSGVTSAMYCKECLNESYLNSTQ